MEYIDIISKEEITEPAMLPVLIVLVFALVAILLTGALAWNAKDPVKASKYVDIVGFSVVGVFVLTYIVCVLFFRVPTGRYEYKATINKENITVSEYAGFIETYNPTVINGVYYWED